MSLLWDSVGLGLDVWKCGLRRENGEIQGPAHALLAVMMVAWSLAAIRHTWGLRAAVP